MANPQNYGLFVRTTDVWDTAELQDIDVTSDAFKELLVRLYQNINNIAVATNAKDSAFYNNSEFVTGGQFFANPALSSGTSFNPTLRPVFRKVINFGALPNTGSKSVAHGITITPSFSFTRIYATATNPNTSFIPIPYASPILVNNIELSVDLTNVTITTGSDRTAYTLTYVVLEYIKT
jgi:hypothetical protein